MRIVLRAAATAAAVLAVLAGAHLVVPISGAGYSGEFVTFKPPG